MMEYIALRNHTIFAEDVKLVKHLKDISKLNIASSVEIYKTHREYTSQKQQKESLFLVSMLEKRSFSPLQSFYDLEVHPIIHFESVTGRHQSRTETPKSALH